MKTPWSIRSQEDCVSSLGQSAYLPEGKLLDYYRIEHLEWNRGPGINYINISHESKAEAIIWQMDASDWIMRLK